MKGEIKTQELADGIIFISLKGSFVGTTVDNVAQTLKGFFERSVYRFIIDITEIDFLPSSVANIFTSVASKVQENKGKVVFIQAKSAEESVFGILGLSRQYLLTSSLAKALAAFQEGPPQNPS